MKVIFSVNKKESKNPLIHKLISDICKLIQKRKGGEVILRMVRKKVV